MSEGGFQSRLGQEEEVCVCVCVCEGGGEGRRSRGALRGRGGGGGGVGEEGASGIALAMPDWAGMIDWPAGEAVSVVFHEVPAPADRGSQSRPFKSPRSLPGKRRWGG